MDTRAHIAGRTRAYLLAAICAVALGAVLLKGRCVPCLPQSPPSATILPYEVDASPSPIEALSTPFLEDLTWMEVRDLLSSGTDRVVIPTGGIEQSGPYVSLNKHDKIVKEVSRRAAKLVGNTLIAPVVSFVPEGSIFPPTGHMAFPGTLSVRSETFEQLLLDLATSLAAHGFKEICIIGDSGDSQSGLSAVATLAQRQVKEQARVRFIPEYYNYPRVREFLKEKGIHETPEKFHDELAFSLQLLAISPESVRLPQRLKAGVPTTGGYRLDTKEAVALGESILRLRAENLAELIKLSSKGDASG